MPRANGQGVDPEIQRRSIEFVSPDGFSIYQIDVAEGVLSLSGSPQAIDPLHLSPVLHCQSLESGYEKGVRSTRIDCNVDPGSQEHQLKIAFYFQDSAGCLDKIER